MMKKLYHLLDWRASGRYVFLGGIYCLILFCFRYIPGGPIIRLSKVWTLT